MIDILEEYIDKSLHALSVKEQNGLIQEQQNQEEKEGINTVVFGFGVPLVVRFVGFLTSGFDPIVTRKSTEKSQVS